MNGLIYHYALHAQTRDELRAAADARNAGRPNRRRLFRRSF
jgi:hypothetical protein